MKIRTTLAALMSMVTLAILMVIGGTGTAQAAASDSRGGETAGRLVQSSTVASADGYASLYVYDFNDGNYWITVSGKANLASTNPGNMYITLYADDTWFDDNIFDTNWLSTAADGSFYHEFPLCCGALNEDWGQDEVYAKVRAWHKPGGGNVTLTTNTVRGDF